MKHLLIAFALTFSLSTLACQCDYGDHPIKDSRPLITSLLQKKLGNNIQIENDRWGNMDMEWVRYYPTLLDRIYAPSERGTSCEGHGPNGEPMMACGSSEKSDYRVSVILASGNKCSALVQVKVSTKKGAVKLLSTDCK